MNEMFTEFSRKAIEFSRDEAARLRHDYIGTEHFLLGLIRLGEGRAIEILMNLGLELDDLKKAIEEVVQPSGGTMTMGQLPLTARAKKTLEMSGQEARALKSKDIDTEHILLALLKDDEGTASQVLSTYEITYGDAIQELKNILDNRPSSFKRKRKKSKTPSLDHFGRDMTEIARRGDLNPIFGRDEEINRLIQVLSRKFHNNPLLIGEPGIGKTAIVEGLAQRIVSERVPHVLQRCRIVALDMIEVLAGAKYRGEFEERLKNIMSEIAGDSDIVIYIDELHIVTSASWDDNISAASRIFRPALSRGTMHCIGSTTIAMYRKHIEPDGTLLNLFQTVEIKPPSLSSTVDILQGLKGKYEDHHSVEISNDSLRLTVELSDIYFPDRQNPSKSIAVLDEACASNMAKRAEDRPGEIVELEKELELLRFKKNEAVKNQQFDAAAQIRDVLKEKSFRKASIERQWEEQLSQEKGRVDAETIIAAVSQMTSIPVENVRERKGIPRRREQPDLPTSGRGVPTFEQKQTASILHGSGVRITTGKGFVLMPHNDECRGIYDLAIRPAMEANGLAVIKAEDIYKPGAILAQVWQEILTSEVIVADMSGKNSNVIYELGLCYGISRCPILLVRNPEELPFNLRSLRYIEYENTAKGTDDLKHKLTAYIEQFLASARGSVSEL